ncbi:metal-dependent hydrolase [Anaeromicropila populeti]|uniref:UPF0173 metal-dependent hydrolase SAMN05661086_00234 n=1 Tax=Anaeromicropila populeti TaxID=37658 RepID=A0A1I6HSK5_9FIRM|nr:metal-dependent hydrolase [Anaeromicropila populeti]SFR57368.1 L-ascorbate metabolism protein UlaG, beta-lactamase superfamily [Anaeromicropila populeti]
MTKIKYLGHSCILLESEDGSVIIDPFLSGNPQTKVVPEDIKVDAVLVTHGHMDHVGDSIEIVKNNNCALIVIDELGKAFQSVDDSLNIVPLSIGGERSFSWGKVKMTVAFHGTDVEFVTPMKSAPPTGFIIEMGGKTLYHCGDTGVFNDMSLIGELNDIDVTALPIGGNFTMDIKDSVVAAKMIKSKKYMPIHFNTFDIISQNVDDWVDEMKKNNLDTVVLENEESYTI